jgi:hypothetical protein
MKKELLFDRAQLKLKPLNERVHDLYINIIRELGKTGPWSEKMRSVADDVVKAKENGRAVLFMMGGHVIRSGVQKYIIDLIEKGYITCIATNGAGAIHDYEFALIGATTESVAHYIQDGQFGLWEETGTINDIINQAFTNGDLGMGEAIGKAINEGDFPYKDISVFAACYRLKVPITVHIGIGYDIIHEHPNFDGAAAGATSYIDFLRFAQIVSKLEGGIVMNFGSAVMAPEVFLKALSMARNVAHQHDKHIKNFTTLVCDLHDMPDDLSCEPDKKGAEYYFRPWKTMLVRTVAGGGKSVYIKGRHAETIPALWSAIQEVQQ